MALEVIECHQHDILEVMSKFKSVYPANPRLQERDYFDWQFHRGKRVINGQGYDLWVLKNNSEIEGFLGYLPIEIRFQSKVYKGRWTNQYFSSARGPYGLQLLMKVVNGSQLCFLMGISDQAEKIYKAMKMPIYKLPRVIGVLKPDALVSLCSLKDKKNISLINTKATCLLQSAQGEGFLPLSRFKDDAEYFPERIFESVEGYARRTGLYLNWRYVDIPQHDYRLIMAESGEEFVVYRVESIKDDPSLKVIRLLEWMVGRENSPAALATVLRDEAGKGAVLVDMFCSSEEVNDLLKDFGFWGEDEIEGEEVPYLFRPLHQASPIRYAVKAQSEMPGMKLNKWYITRGDSDLDRIKL